MLTNRLILNSILKRKPAINVNQVANSSTGGMHDEREKIGKREWVGYGTHSVPNYYDRVDVPMPAVRFKEFTGELLGLREKEKGDWKKLSLEEKKKLYRASFRQTLAEVEAPTGEWKSILAGTFVILTLGLGIFITQKLFVYPNRPDSFKEENREKLLRHMLVNRDGHLTGYSSKWDYEKDDWK